MPILPKKKRKPTDACQPAQHLRFARHICLSGTSPARLFPGVTRRCAKPLRASAHGTHFVQHAREHPCASRHSQTRPKAGQIISYPTTLVKIDRPARGKKNNRCTHYVPVEPKPPLRTPATASSSARPKATRIPWQKRSPRPMVTVWSPPLTSMTRI